MISAAAYLVFAYGMFCLAGQVLLFRDYFSAFGNQDVYVGLFVGASLLWAAAGVIAGRRNKWSLADSPFLPGVASLACILAFFVEYGMIALAGSRLSAGPDVVLPFHRMLPYAFMVVAAMPLQAGFLFPVLSRHARRSSGLSTVGIQAMAAGGGFAGGLGSAALLGWGVDDATVHTILSAVLCGAAITTLPWRPRTRERRAVRTVAAASPAIAVGLVVIGLSQVLIGSVHRGQWHRTQPNGTWGGSFATSEGLYGYGNDNNRWVVVRGPRVFETIGDRDRAGRVAAMALAQNVKASRILVVGDGLSVCEAFLKSSNVTRVDWFSPDRQYIPRLLARLPRALRIEDSRFHIRSDDIRGMLGNAPEEYDIVMVNFPLPVNASSNRYFSVEFFRQVEKSLSPMGFLVLGMPGEDRIRDSQAGYYSAWVKATLDSVFTQTILAPQDRLFFLSAKSSFLQVSPTALTTRFSLVEHAERILPPEELDSVYRPDRAAAILDSYGLVRLPPTELINSDAASSYPLCHLLLSLERSGLRASQTVKSLLLGGSFLAILSVILLGLVRVAYSLRTAPRAGRPFDLHRAENLRSDARSVLSCSGAAGLGSILVILNACAGQGGSWPGCFGWVLSLFVGGLAIGSVVMSRIVSWPGENNLERLRFVLCSLLGAILLQAAALVGLGFGLDSMRAAGLEAMSAAGGFLCGVVWVLAGWVLRACGSEPDGEDETATFAWLFGSAVGSLLAGVVLLPLLGLRVIACMASALVLTLASLAGAMQVQASRPGVRYVLHPILSPAAYGLFGVALCLVAGSHVVRALERSEVSAVDSIFIREWITGNRVVSRTAALTGSSKKVTYQEVREASRLKGYIFRSEDLTGTVYGYGGPMSVILFTKPDGTLIDFRLTRSNETPRYFSRIRDWMSKLKGRPLFVETPLSGVNTVSGATYSSRAVLTLLRNSGRQFAASVLALGSASAGVSADAKQRFDWSMAAWIAAVPLAFGAMYHNRWWSRAIVLAYTAGVSGFWLNRQFSTDHVTRLLDAQNLLGVPSAALLLLVGIPVLIACVGNVYCGYLCPFGALQELLNLAVPARLRIRLSRPVMGVARFVKYGVLFAVVVAFFAFGSRKLLDFDPLTSCFNRRFWSEKLSESPGLIAAVAALAGSLFVTRIWCRYLCPTGAFLSLFNLAGWLQRYLPAKKFGRCEFGLSGRDRLDCIHCDRCRHSAWGVTGGSRGDAPLPEGGEAPRN
jgi:predicted membrane-bound spermidine synthase